MFCRKNKRIQGKVSKNSFLSFRQLKHNLQKAIRERKSRRPKNLCKETDVNLWKIVYRVMMFKIKEENIPEVTWPIILKPVADTVFRQRSDAVVEVIRAAISEITDDKLLKVGKKISDKKTPAFRIKQ